MDERPISYLTWPTHRNVEGKKERRSLSYIFIFFFSKRIRKKHNIKQPQFSSPTRKKKKKRRMEQADVAESGCVEFKLGGSGNGRALWAKLEN